MANKYKGTPKHQGTAQMMPSLGFKANAMHVRAMGHFMQEKHLRAGHNTTPGSFSMSSAPGRVGVSRPGVYRTRKVEDLGAGAARRAIRAGGDVGAQVAAARPVLAARVARRASVQAARASGTPGAVRAARQAGRAAVVAARMSPESRRSERQDIRAAVKGGAKRGFARALKGY